MPAPAPAQAPKVEGEKLMKPMAAQEAALLALQKSLDPKGMVLSAWRPATAPYCSWINVVCDTKGNVVRLTLSYLGLGGSLPPASALTDLPRLQGLLLGGNALKGVLPPGYGESQSLTELYLNDNQLSGTLPASWGKSKSLTELSVAFNNLEGPLPAEWRGLEKVKVLKLNSNKLSGAVPKAWAPPGDPHMSSLETLTLFGNAELSGCLPNPLGAKGAQARGGGLFQGPGGQKTGDAKKAAAGTKITGWC
ncbi:MAG: hypothetical protein J3K34DRAFT_444495 [Monoraphidium minutum]|nr:MAG: hypothetical protein J3K34DRAFT_444495 [Monoraphidium minutum]